MSTCTPEHTVQDHTGDATLFEHTECSLGSVDAGRADNPAAVSDCPAPAGTSRSTLLAGDMDRATQASAIRASLEATAAAINAQHAEVLAAVIEMKERHLHRDQFGYSALPELLRSQFDFTYTTARDIARIATLAAKFKLLAAAAVSGAARIDQVAYALYQLDQTPAMRLFARTPFREAVPSPFDPAVLCTTPEAVVREYCTHAPFDELKTHLRALWAAIADEAELLDDLGQQSLQRLELTETGNGMWHLEGDLTETTGRLLDKYLKTACPPPRQEETDTEGVLPPAANRRAEALHQLLAGYGSSPRAATRHGHTATLDLTVDIATLQGQDTGRTPLLEGRPISLARARLLACEGVVIPSVFNYATGEAVELGRALRLPNAALRRKLELEQPHGCAWSGCSRPVAWCEAHHIVHWADGGPTNADNLILVCRFHHGRLHTTGWSVEKTGPGQAVITHHNHTAAGAACGTDTLAAACHTAAAASAGDARTAKPRTGTGPAADPHGCGCADWRTDADMDAEHYGSDWDVFPTGLYRSEWSETLKADLDGHAQMAEHDRALAAMKAAKAKARERFTTPAAGTATDAVPARTGTPPKTPAPAPAGPVDYGEPPFLPRPSRRLLGDARPHHTTDATPPDPHHGAGPLSMPTLRNHAHPSPTPLRQRLSRPRTSPHREAEASTRPPGPLLSPPARIASTFCRKVEGSARSRAPSLSPPPNRSRPPSRGRRPDPTATPSRRLFEP